MRPAALRQLNRTTVAGHGELLDYLHCSKHPSICQLFTDDRKRGLAKQRQPLSEQAGTGADPPTSSNHFRIEIAQFVAAENHPPKVSEASLVVVVAFADLEKRRERQVSLHLIEDCVYDRRNAVQTNIEREVSAVWQISHF